MGATQDLSNFSGNLAGQITIQQQLYGLLAVWFEGTNENGVSMTNQKWAIHKLYRTDAVTLDTFIPFLQL